MKKRFSKNNQFLILGLFLFAGIYFFWQELNFVNQKSNVLNADPKKLEQLGQHFIIGYDSIDDVKDLVERGAIGGIFVSQKNVQGKSIAAINKEITALQNIQAAHKRAPLIVTTDQEGGIVSRLTPPLSEMPALSSLQPDQIVQTIDAQAKELKSLGINVNLAPVTDINEGLISSQDKDTKIYKRAISNDPATVAQVATTYCETMQKNKILCTLKHFPGLGRVANDTHVSSAKLELPLEELEKHEFIPFRAALAKTDALMMLSHVKLPSIDGDYPASFSKKIIQNIIRNQWNFQGILITDDFSMAAVNSGSTVEDATIQALNGGVDFILISYNNNLYYSVMNAVIQAESENKIDEEMLNQSKQRLEKLFLLLSL